MTRDHVLAQDLGRYLIFLFIVSASFASIVALGFVVGPIRNLPFWSRAWHLVLAVGAWRRRGSDPHRSSRSITRTGITAMPIDTIRSSGRSLFPAETSRRLRGLLYYSFVVGMTSQVADVAIASPRTAQAHDAARHPCVRVQHRRAGAFDQHLRERPLNGATRSASGSRAS
jgi:hypothetical protein